MKRTANYYSLMTGGMYSNFKITIIIIIWT